jgi:hypothetical protein
LLRDPIEEQLLGLTPVELSNPFEFPLLLFAEFSELLFTLREAFSVLLYSSALLTQGFLFERDGLFLPIEEILSLRETTLKLTLLVARRLEFFVDRLFPLKGLAVSIEQDFVRGVLSIFLGAAGEDLRLGLESLKLLPTKHTRQGVPETEPNRECDQPDDHGQSRAPPAASLRKR